MEGAMGKIDEDLLTLGAEQKVLEQTRGVRVRRAAEDAGLDDDLRRALARVDDLDRPACVAIQHQAVIIAIGLHGPLSGSDLARRLGRRLDLHHPLLCTLFEMRPAEIHRNLIGGGDARTAVARMALAALALPFAFA